MSTLDAEFLQLEDGIAHMHIAGMSVFDGPAPTETELRALLASKLHLIPRYRQRVRSVPFELGRPVWVDDPSFDVDYHLRATALPEGSDDAALCRLMGRLMSQELDRDRPLWECWLVHGLPDGQWAVVSKVHHCMVDGVAGVGLLEALLDVEPDAALDEPQPWSPAAEPSGVARVLDAWGGLVWDVIDRVRAVPGDLRDPMGAVRSVWSTADGLVRFGRELLFTPPASVDGAIGPHRAWAYSSASLDDIRRIRKVHGGTVNDVVLAVVTEGFRTLLASRGDDVHQTRLRTLVPVSVRAADAAGVADNRVSAILYELPLAIDDPVVRLHAVRVQMADLKASHMAESAEAVVSAADLMPPMVVANSTRAVMRLAHDHPQRSLNTVTTNVPGPQFPLYCLGRKMVEHRPYVPISHGIRIGTAILSYDGHLSFGVTGDYDTAADVHVVAEGIRAGIDQLLDRT